MQSLTQLSASQLNKMLSETKAELKRRENVTKARKDIQAILKKYNITIHDLEFDLRSGKSATKKDAKQRNSEKNDLKTKRSAKVRATKAPRKNDQRAAVAAKYQNPTTGDKWSGRGRAPLWVSSLCTAETIDIKQFKADPRYRI